MENYKHDILNTEMTKGLIDVETIQNHKNSMLIINRCHVHFYESGEEIQHDYEKLKKLNGVKEVNEGIVQGC